MITCHLLQKTLSFLFKSKDETDWSQQQRSKQVHTRIKRERKRERERESIMAHHRGRVDEKGGEKKGGKKGKKKINFQDRGNSVAFIAILPSHDLENREFLKSGGFAFKKQTVFTPLRPSLAFNPLLLLLDFFFQPWIASSTPLLLSFLFFFLFPPFLRIQSKTNPLEFSKKSQWICRICIIRVSPFDFIPPLRDDLPKSGKNLPAFIPVVLRLSLSLSVSCGLETESFKGERAASDFTPNQRFFTQFLRVFTRSQGGALDNGVMGIVWTISSQTLKDSAF